MNDIAFDAAAITAVIGYTDRILAVLPKLRKVGVLVSCTIGVVYALTIRPGRHEVVANISAGIMVGLASSGGFDGMRRIAEKKK